MIIKKEFCLNTREIDIEQESFFHTSLLWTKIGLLSVNLPSIIIKIFSAYLHMIIINI